MAKVVKVGHSIYENGKVVAEFTRGNWYYYKQKKGFLELAPCSAEKAKEYEDMVDALHAPMSDGELAILHHARRLVERTPFTTKHDAVLSLVEQQIKFGIQNHGPYDPDTDKRDFLALMVRSVTNAVVYGCMYLTQPTAKPVLGERMVRNTMELLERLLN